GIETFQTSSLRRIQVQKLTGNVFRLNDVQLKVRLDNILYYEVSEMVPQKILGVIVLCDLKKQIDQPTDQVNLAFSFMLHNAQETCYEVYESHSLIWELLEGIL